MTHFRFALPLVALGMVAAMPAKAAITWTDWTSISPTIAGGTIGSVGVTIGGDFDTSQISGGGDFWRYDGVNAWAAYDGVSNLPTNNDFVSPRGNGVAHVINFSSPVTNPYLAIISLGRTNTNTTWSFDAPWAFVDQGQGFWGSGTLVQTGNVLSAGEGHGIIRFSGTYSSITLITDNTENWSGLTLGVAAIPEPATWAMLIAGFGLVGFAARRRRTALTA